MPATPKTDPVRRNVRVGPLLLPAEGRKGATPTWPLGTSDDPELTKRELTIWRELWKTPQAVEWERLGWKRVVARYARTLVGAEQLNKDCMSEARQLEDRLGLTPKSMRMLLWQVVTDEVAEKRDAKAATSARGRVKAVG
jgi:hypothetical protein